MREMAMCEGFAELNGCRLFYTATGSGEPVVLIHGFSLDHRLWEPQVDVLRDRFRVIRYDVRGFGCSDDPTDLDYSNVDDLRALLDFLQVERAHLVGLSMGGGIAAELAIAHPERVRTLTCVDAAIGGYRWSNEFRAYLGAVVKAMSSRGLSTAVDTWLAGELFEHSRRDTDVDHALCTMVDAYDGWHWLNRCDALDSSCLERLGEIAVPTLVIVGQHDLEDFRLIAAMIEERVPGAKKVIVPGAGHLSSLDRPGEVSRALRRFMGAPVE
jgi:pimeloyl-ACP methyl ester carboxylesterase